MAGSVYKQIRRGTFGRQRVVQLAERTSESVVKDVLTPQDHIASLTTNLLHPLLGKD